MSSEDRSFFSRWAQRKTQARDGAPPEPEVAVERPAKPPVTGLRATGPAALVTGPLVAPAAAATPQAPASDTQAPLPAPTLSDAQQLTPASDFRPFVGRSVAPEVKNAAFKKLFADPHFNVMDGLDIYIDDYSLPNVLPAELLKQMVSAQVMNLVETPPDAKPAGAAAAAKLEPPVGPAEQLPAPEAAPETVVEVPAQSLPLTEPPHSPNEPTRP